MHISDHPLRLLRAEADRLSFVVSEHLSRYVDRVVSFAGVVAATRNVAVAERGAVQFITLEDERGLVEARLSPQEWRRFHPLLSTPGPYLLRGRVHRRHGALYLAILELLPFHQRASHLPVEACGAATGLD
jgi:DNA polymerase III alpha subunit